MPVGDPARWSPALLAWLDATVRSRLGRFQRADIDDAVGHLHVRLLQRRDDFCSLDCRRLASRAITIAANAARTLTRAGGTRAAVTFVGIDDAPGTAPAADPEHTLACLRERLRLLLAGRRRLSPTEARLAGTVLDERRSAAAVLDALAADLPGLLLAARRLHRLAERVGYRASTDNV